MNGPILENVPIGISTIFYQYRYLLSLLQQRVISWEVIKASLDGSFIQSLPALQVRGYCPASCQVVSYGLTSSNVVSVTTETKSSR